MTIEKLQEQTTEYLSELSHRQLLEEMEQLLNCLIEQTKRNPTHLLKELNNYYEERLNEIPLELSAFPKL
tara:strand:+ start:857 stop:1066 length:210 start_codon:yes stop_codon:yes gene_type:complete